MCRMTNIEELLNLGVPSFLGPQMAPTTIFSRPFPNLLWVYNLLSLQITTTSIYRVSEVADSLSAESVNCNALNPECNNHAF